MLLSYPHIVYDTEKLLQHLSKERAAGKKIVFTNGCYDILHPGHVYLLAEAKKYGDILLVALNTDESVRRQNKGEERPVVSLDARSFVLAHLASVDYVTCFDEDTPYNLIKTIQPDVLIKGGDWKVSEIVGADIVQSKGGEVYSIPLLSGYSTTAIVKKLTTLHQ